MLRNEKRSLFRFLTIYLSSTFLLFLLATFIFYHFQKHQIIDTQNSELTMEAERITQMLQQLSQTFTETLPYPHKKPFDSAIYNLDKEYIFGSFTPLNIVWHQEYYQKGETLFYIHTIHPYYLGASYLVVSKKIDEEPLNDLLKISFLFLLIAGVFFTLLGIFLGKLFIAPMKESITQMNRFIEDTTHEFNTPISTILTNIELLETFYVCEGKKEMQRIEIASKTLSRLYEDLTYLKLNHNYHRDIQSLNFSQLIEERIEYFRTLIEAKKLNVYTQIEKDIVLEIDKNDAIRLIDNILSNAIKYNQKQGDLTIHLTSNSFSVLNSGLGIRKEDIKLIQNRFKRANNSEGGFGIGLDIIGQVVERYKFQFTITSIQHENTEVKIKW